MAAYAALPAALAGIACGGRRGGGDPNNVPRTRRGATAVANAVAFFAMMDAFVRWQGGCCVNMVAAMSLR
jgi:hypothetical protein